MGIVFNENEKVFHLQMGNSSYIMQIVKGKYLAHLYWGKKLTFFSPGHLLTYKPRSSFSPNPDNGDSMFSLDTLPQEYPAYGNSDFRNPAFHIQYENGTTVSELAYQSHKIFKGKPKLDGLPATYVESKEEAETLELYLADPLTNLKATLFYTVYNQMNVLTRSVRFENLGSKNAKLMEALSMSIDLNDSNYDLLHLYGSWAKERYIERKPLMNGLQSIYSNRGSSSHQHNPFMAILRPDADEDKGEVYGFSFVYSGNFVAQAEVDQYSTTRITMGISPFDFSWLLKPGQSFQTPEVVMVYSFEGLGDMSRTYHDLYRTRLCRGIYRDQTRPILINNWEATYFDFNAEKIENIARTARQAGIELFVLDDGWFGKRNNDNCSLGDWYVNKEKLPKGLNDLADRINKLNMKFGLWVEPEMISPDSDLYRKHPDWCLHVDNRHRTQARNQLVLDYSRQDVCDEIINVLTRIFSSVSVSYVKWDMNRNMTEIGSKALPPERQRETAHRYILGLYRVLEVLTLRFPDILFESCSGGGGRFDPGMLYFMPQTWTSDNTDAIERIKIQYGTSIVYPAITMGAHVSTVPNQQVRRTTPLETRGNVAMSGNFGYELDLTKLSSGEYQKVKEQVAFYKGIRELVQFGDFYRLISPFSDNSAAWMFVSKDKKEAFVAYFKILNQSNDAIKYLRLKGLNKDFKYVICDTGEKYGGDELLYAGIPVPDIIVDFKNDDMRAIGDFDSLVWHFKADIATS
jgi:alpha-galactosidase